MYRTLFALLPALLLGAAPSSGQHFERLHSMIPDRVPIRGAVADLDGDEDLDVVDRLTGSELHVLENDGTGYFRLRVRGVAAADPGATNGAVVGDVDGDGDPDLLFGLSPSFPGATNVPWLLFHNDGHGGFADASALVPPGPRYVGIRVAHLNDDGFLDVYAYDGPNAGSPDGLWLGDGAGGFVVASAGLPTLHSDTAQPIDFEGDGDVDVLSQVGTAAPVLLVGDGSGAFTLQSSPGLALAGPLERVQDVDEDGRLDVVSFEFDDGSGINGVGDRWNENLGGGLFGPHRPIVSLNHFRGGLVLVDWSGDGRQDALASSPGPFGLGQLYVYRGDGAGHYALVSHPTLEALGATTVYPGDWDGDGDTDLSAGVPVWNRGEGIFRAAYHPPEPGSYEALSLQDVDRDADLDLLATQPTTQSGLFLSRNDGTGGFGSLVRVVFPTALSWTTLDLHGDGDADLLLASELALGLFESDGAGAWSDVSSRLPSLPGFPSSLAGTTVDFESGDFNADGLDDCVIGLERSSGLPLRAYLLLADGAGGLAQGQGAGQAVFQRSTAGDLDGDGDLDLVIIASDRNVRTYLNSGAGALSAVGSVLVFEGDVTMSLADLSGDGALELVVYEDSSSTSPRRFSIFESDGAGSFGATAATVVPLDPGVARPGSEIFALDFDLDGALDLLFSEGYLFRNLGGLSFEEVPPPAFPSVPFGPGPLAVGDLDLDGDEDVWLGSPSEIHWNIRRQVAWRTWPKVGKRLVIDVLGSPSAAWILIGSSALASVPTAYGLLRLDLSQAFHVGPALLDPQGRANATFAVPQQASLFGATFYWQALVGAPLELGNVETTLLSGF